MLLHVNDKENLSASSGQKIAYLLLHIHVSPLPVNMTVIQRKGFPETLLCLHVVFDEEAEGTIIQPVVQVLGLPDQPLGSKSIGRDRVIATPCPTLCAYSTVNAPKIPHSL